MLFPIPIIRTGCCLALLLCATTKSFAEDNENGEAASGEAAAPLNETKPLPTLELDDEPEAQPEPKEPVPPSPIRTTPIARKPTSAAEMLEFFDIDASVLRQLIDQRPIHADEREAISHLLFALPKLPAEYLSKWTETSPDWDAIINAPEDYRTKLYELHGHVTHVEKIELIPEAALRYDFTHYYQATVELGEDRWKATVCSRRIPLSWKQKDSINEAVSFRGMFLKMGDGPVFATKRIAWHPNRLEPEAGITRSQVILGDLGMDIGLWDDVRDRKPLVSDDREAFYQLLNAIERSKPENIRSRSKAQFSFADILRHPKQYHGQLLNVQGTARRCSKIIVSDEDIRARFGIDYYYEIYLTVNLETKIVYRDDDTGKTVEFQSFPVVVCARQLPPGMPEGDDIFEAVDVSGAFFKLWAYKSGKMTAFNPNQMQLCPMLVTLEPNLLEREKTNPYVGITIGGLFIVALLGIWISVWRFGREDAQFARTTLKRQYEVEEGKSLNDLGIEARGGPDFSHLE